MMVGDTFVFNEETSLNLSAAAFPYFRSWVMSGKEEAFLENMNASLLSEFMVRSQASQLRVLVGVFSILVGLVSRLANDFYGMGTLCKEANGMRLEVSNHS